MTREWGRVFGLLIILLLLLVLLIYRLQSTPLQPDWNRPVQLLIFPVNADAEVATAAYIASLKPADFYDIEHFFAREAWTYRIHLARPVEVKLQPAIDTLPPDVPQEPSILDSIWWGLKMRLWVAANERFDIDDNSIRVFMNVYSLQGGEMPAHSLGLQKGRIGLVNGYADPELQGVNNFVAVHEALHTLGATDRYHPQTAEPLWPDGYADPTQVPLFPQTRAEVMGGRMMIVPGWAVLPPSLDHVRMGPVTATEIGWRDPHMMKRAVE